MSARMNWNGDAAKRAVEEAAARGLKKAAEHILTESRKIVPIEEGTLERSGEVSIDEGKLIAAVSYSTPYAVKQHEDLSLRHDAGRRGKYLESIINSEGDEAQGIVAAEVRRALR